MKKFIALFSVIIWGCFVQPAWSVPFSGAAVGSWIDVVSSNATDVYNIANGDAGGVSIFDWGIPSSTPFNSSFTFNGVGSDGGAGWFANSESPFLIGYFSYTNGSTFNSIGVDGVTLDILLLVNSPVPFSRDFIFPFIIINTMNWTGDPVLDADIVNVTSTFSPTIFNYGGTRYTLELLGFSSDGGATIRTDFSSPESGTADAGVYARITSEIPTSPVPEPGALLLLATGMGGLALFRKRRT